MANSNPSGLGAFTFNLRLPGQYFDLETNYHYNYFRNYSPELGRYFQSDPIGLIGGLNTYQYALNSPIRNIDPFGLDVLREEFRRSIMERLIDSIMGSPADIDGKACAGKLPCNSLTRSGGTSNPDINEFCKKYQGSTDYYLECVTTCREYLEKKCAEKGSCGPDTLRNGA